MQAFYKNEMADFSTSRGFGKRMAILANTKAFPVRYKRKEGGRAWIIERSEFEQYLKTGNAEEYVDERTPY